MTMIKSFTMKTIEMVVVVVVVMVVTEQKW